jgi:hypothetical protein
MTRTPSGRGAWAFETLRGSVRVAPDELRIRRGVVGTLTGSVRALADGRTPLAFREVGWAGVAGLTTVATAAMEWFLGGGGTTQLWLGALGLVATVSGVAASAANARVTTVSLRDLEHVTFEEDELVVVHRDGDESDEDGDGDDDEPETERVRPIDDEARADAAVALRLRGVELRGVEGDEAVSRTVVDAPKTSLLAESESNDA